MMKLLSAGLAIHKKDSIEEKIQPLFRIVDFWRFHARNYLKLFFYGPLALCTMGFAIENDLKKELLKAAHEVRAKAYAPYSKYYVGAALLTPDGKIFAAPNVENASYGLTCCAERNAVFKAVSEGAREFVAVAISLSGKGMPCGACRQVLNEFNPKMTVFACDEKGNLLKECLLSDLLPDSFGPHNLTSQE
jgi:cytidine deaminase